MGFAFSLILLSMSFFIFFLVVILWRDDYPFFIFIFLLLYYLYDVWIFEDPYGRFNCSGEEIVQCKKEFWDKTSFGLQMCIFLSISFIFQLNVRLMYLLFGLGVLVLNSLNE